MTREEALKVLEVFLYKQCDLGRTEFAYDANTVWEAVNMANKALEQEPCTDAISRQAVLEVIEKCHCEEWVKADIGAPIEALPPVTAEKVGQWIDTDNYYQRWKCSECGCHTRDARPNYCSNCGAKMQASPTGAESEVQDADSD